MSAAALKVTCPACTKSLKILQSLPARVRCPKCNARLAVGADGKTDLVTDAGPVLHSTPVVSTVQGSEPSRAVADPSAPGNPLLLWGVVGGGVAVLGLAVWLLVANLGGGPVKEEEGGIVLPRPGDGSTTPTTYVATVADGKSGPLPSGMAVVFLKGGDGFTEIPAKTARPSFVGMEAEPHPGVDQAKVNAAIDKGVEYLKKNLSLHTQGPALVGLTLLSCGISPDDPAVRTIAKKVRAGAPSLSSTYELATYVWFLDKLGQTQDRELIRDIAYRFMNSQQMNGGWGYTVVHLTPEKAKDWQAALAGQGGASLFANHPLFQFAQTKTIKAGGGYADNSITQFGVLALWVAKKYDVPVERSLAMVEARFRTLQSPNGSWSYSGNSWKDSMTCAGLMGLAVGRGRELNQSQMKKADDATDPAIEKGFAYLSQRLETLAGPPDPASVQLQKDISDLQGRLYGKKVDAKERAEILKVYRAKLQEFQKKNPGKAVNASSTGRPVGADAHGDLYFLWSLERMAVVYDLRTIGKTDWYGWGANLLINSQKPDGSWVAGHGAAADTSFALLFLRRANVVQDLTAALQNLSVSKDAGERGGAQGNFGQGVQGQGPSPVIQGAVKGLQ